MGIRWSAICSLLLVVCGVTTGFCRGDERPPNIIFIMADDLGWQDVGYAGTEFFETPAIDRLAATGMTFTAAYSGGPNCAPTRACIMSGMYTPRHHIYTPGGQSKGKSEYMRLLVPAVGRKQGDLQQRAAEQFPIANALNPAVICIPEVLKTAGYQTARIGKWHLGPDTQGFDLSSANGSGGPEGSFYGNVNVAKQLTDRAVGFIEQNAQRPFFLYLTHWDVHVPHRAIAEVTARYARKLQSLPANERRNFDPTYAAMIEAVDQSVARVVEAVDRLGLADNTLIVFTSDNGGLPGVSQLAPLRGQKGSLFEAGVRVPLCVRWKGHISSGSICPEPVTSVDFLPTFASLANAELPAQQPVDGVDVSPLFAGQEIAERSIFWHYPLYLSGQGLEIDVPGKGRYSWRGFPSTSLRRGRWKLIEFHEDQTLALYDLQSDPGERHNVAERFPDQLAALRRELKTWQEETKAPIPTVPNPEAVPGIRSLLEEISPGR